MACCAIEDCGDPRCQVCSTTRRGFPQPVFKDHVLTETRAGTKPTRAGERRLAGERKRADTATRSRRGPR